MIFLVIALVTAIACSIITVRTLVSYSDLRRGTKILIALFVVLGWFAPLIIGGLGQLKFISDTVFAVISFCGFTLFGFVFLLWGLPRFVSFFFFHIISFGPNNHYVAGGRRGGGPGGRPQAGNPPPPYRTNQRISRS